MKKEQTVQLTKYNSACGRVRALLNRWLESGLELFIELRKIERDGDWQAPGHATFSDFLRAEFPNAIGIDRYQNVMRAIDVHGVEFVKKIGVHAAHAASVSAIAEHPERLQLLQQCVNKHIEDRKVPPERDEVIRMVRDIAPETAKPRGMVRALLTEQSLRETVTRLTKELREARARIRELEREKARAVAEKSPRSGQKRGGR